MPYEIQTYMLIDGWTNTWSCQDIDGVMRPETFATADEAEGSRRAPRRPPRRLLGRPDRGLRPQ